MRPGANAIGITVAEGWYRGRFGFEGGRREIYGQRIGPIAQLELHYADGTTEVIATDHRWRAATGPHLAAGLYDGERYDARLAEPAWSTADFDDAAWVGVEELASVAEGARRTERSTGAAGGDASPGGDLVLAVWRDDRRLRPERLRAGAHRRAGAKPGHG